MRSGPRKNARRRAALSSGGGGDISRPRFPQRSRHTFVAAIEETQGRPMGTDERRVSTQNSRRINAPRSAIYRAFTDSAALVAWQVPGEMTAKVHAFDARAGGGYRMSLFYPTTEEGSPGKSAA